MPRHSGDANGFVDRHCKIRKRVCSSSSTTPSVLKNYRFKRAILVAKRGVSTTPVPMWTMNVKSPSSAANFSEKSQYQQSKSGHGVSQSSFSARKLANALWELNRIPSPNTMEELQKRRLKKEMIRGGRKFRSNKQGSLSHHLPDPSHSRASQSTCRSRLSSKRKILPLFYQSSHRGVHNCMNPDMLSHGHAMEMEAHSQCITPRSSNLGTKIHLKELKKSLITLKELLKLLNRFLGSAQQHPSIIALSSALRAQVDQASVQVNHIIQDEWNEIIYLKKQFEMEKDSWKSKEQERVTSVAQSIMKELEMERKSRRRAERLNKTLGMELAQIKTSLLKTSRELESQKRKREVIEQVCSEMVRYIGQDKAEVEELKRESVKVREELEKEREMLHLANEWREERVHMKLSEAKFQFEEKNAAVDQLRNELEAFLTAKRTESVKIVQGQLHDPRTVCADLVVDRGEGSQEEGQEGDYETDSEDSELHSIELNMNSNDKGYGWSYATAAFEQEDGLVSFEENNEEKSTFSGVYKINSSFDKSMAGAKNEFDMDEGKYADDMDEGEFTGIDQKVDQDAKRCLPLNGPRDQTLFGSKIVLPRGMPSPIRKWSKQLSLQHSSQQLCEGSKVNEMLKAIRESESKARLVRNRNEVHSQLQIPSSQ